jgi:hypothetical protein
MNGRSGCQDHVEDDVAHQAVTSAVQMEERMDEPSQSVRTYLDGVTPERRRRDAEDLLELMARVTAESPRLFGPHTTGVGCLYIKDLNKIDISVLEGIVTESHRTLTADTARDGVATAPDE